MLRGMARSDVPVRVEADQRKQSYGSLAALSPARLISTTPESSTQDTDILQQNNSNTSQLSGMRPAQRRRNTGDNKVARRLVVSKLVSKMQDVKLNKEPEIRPKWKFLEPQLIVDQMRIEQVAENPVTVQQLQIPSQMNALTENALTTQRDMITSEAVLEIRSRKKINQQLHITIE